MKNIRLFLMGFVFVCLLSCEEEDGEENSPDYSFEDQILQGKINGQDFLMVDGFSEVSFFEESEISVDIGQIELTDPCDVFFIDGLKVFFSVPNQVGLYPLSFDLSNENSQTITLFDPEETLNIILIEGALEILSISDTEVTGRIDGRSDSDNFVNGNFSVTFCPEEE